MLESEIKKLTAAITRLADLMEGAPAATTVQFNYENEVITPTPFKRAPADLTPADEKAIRDAKANAEDDARRTAMQAERDEQAKVAAEELLQPAPSTEAMRQSCQDLCLTLVRADRMNKAVIAEWLLKRQAKTIKQLGDESLAEFTEFLEWLDK